MSRTSTLASGRLVHCLVLGLCAATAAFWWGVLQPAQARVDQARLRAVRVHGQASAPAQSARVVLPPETGFPDVLDALALAAQEAGLSFDEGSYQVARQAQGMVVRYEITMPLHGAYPQLRTFLATVATALPGLVVDNVQLQRRAVDDTALDARLRLAMLMEARP